jgi:hypothetical protein
MPDFAKHLWDWMWNSPQGHLSFGAILALILFRELRNRAKRIPSDAGQRAGQWIAKTISKLRRERL